jgi:predicted NUDIX family NTP pyrophosphohydrolase
MRQSAGILLYKWMAGKLLFFLVHPGGPFWEGKDEGAWTIPKGEYGNDELPLTAALRELKEETGTEINGPALALTPITQKAGKQVTAFAVEGDIDPQTISSNHFRMQWPYKSGKWISVPEIDKGGWFDITEAKRKMNPAQVAFLDELSLLLDV